MKLKGLKSLEEYQERSNAMTGTVNDTNTLSGKGDRVFVPLLFHNSYFLKIMRPNTVDISMIATELMTMLMVM